MTKPVDGGVCAPKGFRAAGVRAGIKASSTKKDCALIVSDAPAVVAGMFTRNVMKAPCVHWNAAICREGKARAFFINSGNANAATGERGAADVRTTAAWVAEGLGLSPNEVCIESTGVIGLPLPMDRIEQGVKGCLAALAREGSADAAVAIMTTDTVPKEMAVEVAVAGGAVRIGAIAKGAGMIAPGLVAASNTPGPKQATMICAITTDAALDPGVLADLLHQAVEVSFNRMCVDNDMSTSDMVVCLANGQSGVGHLTPLSPDYEAFAAAFTEVCRTMAQKLVRDGEGATKFVEIEVSGADTDEAALIIARSIASSQLCKTAFFGQDPNWGRIACAAGYAGVPFDPNALDIWLGDIQLLAGGQPAAYEEADAAAVMKAPEFKIRVRIGGGAGSAVFWTSDLSHGYVSINADYRT